MLKNFGIKVKQLRMDKGMTREEFCEDESELSVRQLARIELGDSLPNLKKAIFIAKRLNIMLSILTDGETLELPKEYLKLKHYIIKIPTYSDSERLATKENYFDLIYEEYYDNLPEVEKLVIDTLQATHDSLVTENFNFGAGILGDYFEQLKRKVRFDENDLVLINLYLTYLDLEGFNGEFSDEYFYDGLFESFKNQFQDFTIDELIILNQVLITMYALVLKNKSLTKMEEILKMIDHIMERTKDFSRLPIQKILEWKYQLCIEENESRAKDSYNKALLFAQMTDDKYLEEQLIVEWNKDTKK
ncbi:helix-turn-helix domain-containing protein [Streptococcus hyovaginalis]|uniref:helix-turn-helix domain-containing protein n=1 Tax=Streptococcus hyovaginalis TaxID=149015 RepID=UPI0004052B3F|nr:XRE family transcriptional regulator [Streptococcus hyovaginalis]